ncbi:MAG TPA: hypothetical protein VD930_03095 [Gemmatimonadales bacterium]|nr:hypothetical protein [Gemmatimonadales bacterium]
MEAPFDVEGLAKDLLAFQTNASFHLTDDTPLPDAIAEPLWKAHDLVVGILAALEQEYGFSDAVSWGTWAQSRRPEEKR